jgi:hypothetical protein
MRLRVEAIAVERDAGDSRRAAEDSGVASLAEHASLRRNPHALKPMGSL